MEAYETDILTYEEKRKFLKWFDEEIGTDYEVNNDPSGEIGKYYIVFFDLTPGEVNKIRSWEIALDHNRGSKTVDEWEVN